MKRMDGDGLSPVTVIAGCLLCLLAVGTTPGVTAAVTGVPGDQPGVAQQATPSNNTTVQHERPDEIRQSGDAERVSQWLAGRLGNRLEGSAIRISQGEYEQANEFLGDDYDSRLSQYVDVAGETDRSSDDESADHFEQARERQRNYSSRARSFEESYESYQEARDAGNETAARQHARDLIRHAERIEELNESLSSDYERIENQTGVSLGNVRLAIANTTTNVSEQRAAVENATFVRTRLEVSTNGTETGFDDPLGISGRVVTENGTPIANETARVVVYERVYETSTDADGRFTVTYRPVLLPVEASRVTIRFVPDNTSVYLASETSADVRVSQVTPTLDVRVEPATVRYRDRFETDVVAAVDDRPVPILPVEAELAGTTVGSGRTASDGRIRIGRDLPAGITPGNRRVVARAGAADRAIGPANASARIAVEPTETRLSTSADANDSTVVVSGRLETAGGRGIAGRDVAVSAEGGVIDTVRTNDTGWYRTVVPESALTSQSENASSVVVTARFDGRGTNLESSEARSRIQLADSPAPADGNRSPSWLLLGAGILVVVGLIGAGLYAVRSAPTERSHADSKAQESDGTATATTTDTTATRWLERARTALDDGDIEAAVVTAYATVRHRLESETELPTHLTHREFAAACESHLDDEESTALSRLSEAYERATFASEGTADVAREAITAASELLGTDPERAE